MNNQITGELSAIASMEVLRTALVDAGENKKVAVVDEVLKDERNHVVLIGQLLRACGEEPAPPFEPSALDRMEETQLGCAIAPKAEAIRGAKIRIVISDPTVADDMKEVLSRILREEGFHEKAFARMAGEEGRSQFTQDLTACW